jgi:secondary thiamine-phosphate synthase enzyme
MPTRVDPRFARRASRPIIVDAREARLFHSESFSVASKGRGTYEITAEVARAVRNAGIERGLCTVFVHHTSASLIICENADPSVRSDLDRYFTRLVPDGDPVFRHTAEGPDDMPAHVRSILTASSLAIPVADSEIDLGTWQGVFLWEHRTEPHRRRITVSVVG